MTLEISLLRVVVVNFGLLYAANGESNLERERERERERVYNLGTAHYSAVYMTHERWV